MAEAIRLENILILCGPSGSGKTTLKNRLTEDNNIQFGYSISDTTRKRRDGEVDGVDYYFTNEVDMKKDITERKFYETVVYNGDMYGTRKQSVKDVTESGKICIMDIAVEGVKRFKAIEKAEGENFNFQYVFVKPPSMEVLMQRLRNRGTETEESLQKRMKIASEELQYGEVPENFDMVITNDNIDEAYKQLLEFVKKEFYLQ